LRAWSRQILAARPLRDRGALDGDGARRIDLGDATILPGIVDLHVHDVHAGNRDGTVLRTGVTTVRNVGMSIAFLSPSVAGPGLRVLAAGPIVTSPAATRRRSGAIGSRCPSAGRRTPRARSSGSSPEGLR
jgi:hypothetical protein